MHEFYRIIDEQANHMRGLLADLLDPERIETGTVSLAPEPAVVAGLVERARSTFLSGGGRHGVLVDMPAGLPSVMVDRRRIVQVLSNLFANAARHAPASSPIRVAAAREGAHVAVSVSDEGPGVEPERLPHLFRRYARAGEGRYGRPRAGARALQVARGSARGRIRAESAGPSRGTTFTVPVAGESVAPAAGHAAGPPPAADRAGPGRRASSSWTTTRRCCISSAARSRRQPTPRW